MYERDEKCIQHFGRKTRRDHSEDLGVDVNTISELDLNEKCNGKLWTRYIWLRIGTTDGLKILNTVMNIQVP
jgi:hypothetical protein